MPNLSASDKLLRYRRGDAPLPSHNRLWPLYGAGFDRLGRRGRPVEGSVPHCDPDELLLRHDASGLCFSDFRVIRAGQEHPRVYRDMEADPVVLGHEVCMTVVGVGEHLCNGYKVEDRFIVQPGIYLEGVGFAYGYEIQGGLSQYSVIDRRVLHGDHGNCLVPIQPGAGYAEAALTESWVCVNAAHHLKYRTSLKRGGTAWIVASPKGPGDRPYTQSAGFDEASHPRALLLTNVPNGFAAWLERRAAVSLPWRQRE
ncbi:MAG: alcohol dehydrogenase catalytic domain-containing protein [Chloroflexota bacterium]|nr:alcohol dehydrogenase catalytic domain-containing protein [Anaerolineae bacterium]